MEVIYIVIVILILFSVLSFYRDIIIQKIDKDNADNNNNSTPVIGECSSTKFGCCPNGITSKLNMMGSNCNIYSQNPPGSNFCDSTGKC